MKETFDKHIYRVLLSAVVLILAAGSIFYHFVEHWSWLNSYYFSVVTLTTVGFGDLTPRTDIGKIFTTFYLMIGIGIITTFISYSLRRRGSKYIDRKKTK
jgi:voltage-gated potassium channel Kch